MTVDGRSFLRGALFGSVAAIVALGLGAKAFAQTDLQQDPALHARNDVSEQATVLGGDWGTLHVEARDGQRIPASLSLSEVTRMEDVLSSSSAQICMSPSMPNFATA